MSAQTTLAPSWTCEECGYANNAPEAISCDLCSRPRAVDAGGTPAEPAPRLPVAGDDRLAEAFADRGEQARRSRLKMMAWMGGGAVLGALLGNLPLLAYIGWFLASLTHELGHCVAAWIAGMPAAPAINLGGHAAAIHGAQSKAFVFTVTLLLLAAGWQTRDRGLHWPLAFGVGAVLQLIYAFSAFQVVVFLLAGHLGELVFAGIFLWRGFSGGFTSSPIEQGLYALGGGHLVWRNLWLNGGLLWSPERRAWYEGSGSFGLRNDFLRLAEDVLHGPLAPIAAFMLVLTVLCPLVAFGLARWHLRQRKARAEA